MLTRHSLWFDLEGVVQGQISLHQTPRINNKPEAILMTINNMWFRGAKVNFDQQCIQRTPTHAHPKKQFY